MIERKRFLFNARPSTGLETTFLTSVNLLLIVPNLIFSTVIFVPAYAFVAWLLSLTPLGVWVAAGLKMLYVNVQHEDLYKIGAALGFVRSFFIRSGAGSKFAEPTV